MRSLSIIAVFFLAAGCVVSAPAWGQIAAVADRPPLQAADWPLERVEMLDGRQYAGLIESEDDCWVHLVQIQRPAGKPMHLVIRPIERRRAAKVVRLDPPQRDQLRQRIEQVVNRASIEAGRMDAVRLESIEEDGRQFRRYRGKWFSLQSTIDEPTTRRIVVRVEQMFTAYRQVLPPRSEPPRTLRLLVFGTLDEYHACLDRLGLRLDNRACFLPKENLVLAGSEVARFAAELAKVGAQHEQLGRELGELEKCLKQRLQELSQQLQQDGAAKREATRLLTAEKRKTQEQIERKQREIARCNRENEQLFDRVTRQMFTRLYHEAFHAYLENYVYSHDRYDVPAWLNEGLAVLFEAGLLESDSLRIDAPNAAALRGLKADLGAGQPLELATLLAADQSAFAVAPDASTTHSDRLYFHAWGLVYYLTFEKHLLGSAALDRYVQRSAACPPPAPRFERLVDMPLDQFERQWRDYTTKLQ